MLEPLKHFAAVPSLENTRVPVTLMTLQREAFAGVLVFGQPTIGPEFCTTVLFQKRS
jgi:hypothetical protein